MFNMKIELKELLVELLTHEDVVGSWGLTQIKIGEATVSFLLSGFKFKGRVQIKCQKEGYIVIIGKTKYEGIRLYEIIEIIDGEIEMSSEYCEQIVNWVTK